MKRYLSLGLLLLSYFALTGCSTNRNTSLNIALTNETWMREVDADPNKWARGADAWFLTGDPATTNTAASYIPNSAPMSTLNINVPEFSKIKVNGDFQVQIFGTTNGSNSVYVYGPNDAVTSTVVNVQGGTLCLNQQKKVPRTMGQVIIRIGVSRLNSLVQLGRGRVEGIQLNTNYLTVTSMGSGHVYLAGSMNLKTLVNLGRGCVTIFGANTPELDIKTNGTGITNVSGNVGIRSIMHHGRNDINIIGANSDNLRIYADGRGKIGINGIVNLREVKARDFTRVFAYKLTSTNLYAYAYDRAHIGLAGLAQNLYLDAFNNSCVGGRNLCADNAYVRVHQNAHVNIAAGNKIFAASTEHGSVYFFGSPNLMSQFVSGNGTIIPIWSNGHNSCPIVQEVYRPSPYKAERMSYKGEGGSGFPYSKWKNKRKKFRGEG